MITVSTGIKSEGRRCPLFPIDWTKKDCQVTYTDCIGNKYRLPKESRGLDND